MNYTVEAGDCMTSIASQRGLFWRTIWEHSQNAQLKDLRKNPNVLMVGDEVYVPDLVPKYESVPTDKRHRFVCRNSATEIRLRILHDGEPLKNKNYNLDLDGRLSSGATDARGQLTMKAPPGAQRATVTFLDPDFTETYVVMLGHLNPISDISGIQQRLSNLGCGCQVTGEMDQQTRDAISHFVVAFNQGTNVELNGDLRGKIESVHGV